MTNTRTILIQRLGFRPEFDDDEDDLIATVGPFEVVVSTHEYRDGRLVARLSPEVTLFAPEAHENWTVARSGADARLFAVQATAAAALYGRVVDLFDRRQDADPGMLVAEPQH